MKAQEISLYIQNLELELLHHDWTEDPQSIDELLSADFEEIDANGTVHSRHEVVQWLMQKDKMQRWSLLNFRIKLLTDECVLAIYNACKENDSSHDHCGSIRTSIWQIQNNQWKMIFHQASKIS